MLVITDSCTNCSDGSGLDILLFTDDSGCPTELITFSTLKESLTGFIPSCWGTILFGDDSVFSGVMGEYAGFWVACCCGFVGVADGVLFAFCTSDG